MYYLRELIQAYFEEINEDPHGRFAELTGMDRQEAKVEFYKFAYSRPILKSTMDCRPKTIKRIRRH